MLKKIQINLSTFSMETIIRSIVTNALEGENITDQTVEVQNISDQHAGHFTGNGQTHFVVTVRSQNLMKLKPIVRHKLLNNAVSHLLKTEQVHAISFKTSSV